jgi:DNA-binding SARP family transcriptional activator
LDRPISLFRLELLRSFELLCDSRHVALTGGAQRLLALLALRQRAVRRQTVARTLWRCDTPERLNGNLRSALWRLNRVDRRLVDSTGDLLLLSPRVEVDVAAAAEQARHVLDGAAATAVRWQDLSSDLLPDWQEEWVRIERERYRQLRLHALEALANRLSRIGRHADAIEAATTAVHAEPLRESAHRALIAAYLACGRRPDALSQYLACRELLQRTLDVAPSRQLERIVAGR